MLWIRRILRLMKIVVDPADFQTRTNSLLWLNIRPCYLDVKKHVTRQTDKLDILKHFLCQVQNSEANNQSRIASFTCVSKVIYSIEERMFLLSFLQHIYIFGMTGVRCNFALVSHLCCFLIST